VTVSLVAGVEMVGEPESVDLDGRWAAAMQQPPVNTDVVADDQPPVEAAGEFGLHRDQWWGVGERGIGQAR
jgi:hypothetical protein